jgi:hypothetical protein
MSVTALADPPYSNSLMKWDGRLAVCLWSKNLQYPA